MRMANFKSGSTVLVIEVTFSSSLILITFLQKTCCRSGTLPLCSFSHHKSWHINIIVKSICLKLSRVDSAISSVRTILLEYYMGWYTSFSNHVLCSAIPVYYNTEPCLYPPLKAYLWVQYYSYQLHSSMIYRWHVFIQTMPDQRLPRIIFNQI